MIGTTLGHYRIVEQIGAGGMGVVYRAQFGELALAMERSSGAIRAELIRQGLVPPDYQLAAESLQQSI